MGTHQPTSPSPDPWHGLGSSTRSSTQLEQPRSAPAARADGVPGTSHASRAGSAQAAGKREREESRPADTGFPARYARRILALSTQALGAELQNAESAAPSTASAGRSRGSAPAGTCQGQDGARASPKREARPAGSPAAAWPQWEEGDLFRAAQPGSALEPRTPLHSRNEKSFVGSSDELRLLWRR